jgi:uncharacterized protein (TIGR04255 family)
MTVRFPSRENVKLGRSPLAEVICQVRFSPILRIGAEQPIAFQDAIRQRFPQYSVEQGFTFQIHDAIHAQNAPSFRPTPNLYRFTSTDGHSEVSLAQDFFALVTKRYTTWEEFAKRLELVSNTVMGVYEPTQIHRVGLRYVNELVPARLGLGSFEEILALLQPTFTSALKMKEWSLPKAYGGHLELDVEGDTLAIRYQLRQNADGSPEGFLLDFDYYEESGADLNGLIERCDRFHNVIYNAFRWTIPDEKLHIFEPRYQEGSSL